MLLAAIRIEYKFLITLTFVMDPNQGPPIQSSRF